MKTPLRHTIAFVTLLTIGQSPSLLAQDAAAPKDSMSRIEARHATLTAEVTAINPTNREVTLKGPQGNEVTVEAGPAVKRFDEVKVGDYVRVDYLVAAVAELRPPTPEEAQHPLVLMDAAGRAPTESEPAAGIGRRLKIVTTIEALNRPEQTVTVKGPLGNYLTAHVLDPNRLTKVHIGDTIVIVYTEALALSLEKAEKKTAE